MTKTISIHGVEVAVSTPYEAGQTINEAEAKVLNQTRAENIANNSRKKIKAALDGAEGAEPMEKVLADLAAYDKDYVFTLAAAGGSRATMTPLEKEANRLAKQWLVAKLKESGVTFKAYSEAKGADFVQGKVAEIAEQPEIQKMAKANVAAAAKTADAVAVDL